MSNGPEEQGQAAGGADSDTNPKGVQEDSQDSDASDSTRDSEAEYEQSRSDNLKLRSELNSAREELEALQRTQRSAEENARRDIDKLKNLQSEFELFKKTTFLELAISKETKFEWHPNAIADVRNSIDFSKVNFSDLKDGKMTVEGLDLELKRIAQEKPYLLKPKEQKQPKEDKASGGGVASGAHPYGSSSGSKSADTDLLKKYKIA